MVPGGGRWYQVVVPEGVMPGDKLQTKLGDVMVQVQVPDGLKPGDAFQVQAPPKPGARGFSPPPSSMP